MIHVIQGAYNNKNYTDSIGLIRLNGASQSSEANPCLLEACCTCTVGREGPWISHLQKDARRQEGCVI